MGNQSTCTQPLLRVRIEHDHGSQSLDLDLSEQSCWANLFGVWAQPQEGAIDELNEFFDGHTTIKGITLIGCPSACLLPMLWIRTIWFASECPPIHIVWETVDDPSNNPGRQQAGKLSTILAQQVSCDDPELAWSLWGIDLNDQTSNPEEAFDLIANIIDLWDFSFSSGRNNLALDWNSSVQRALLQCASRGLTRVGIYGGGTHTRAVGDALMEPSVEIVCIIDDDTRRHGQRMWGYEIVSRERAIELDLHAVVISANSIEDRLWENADQFRQQGITTLRLYADAP